MRLIEVTATNIDIIHSLSEVNKEDSPESMGQGKPIPPSVGQVLKRVIIRIKVDQISAPEVLAIQKIASSVIVNETMDASIEERLSVLAGSGLEPDDILKQDILKVAERYPNHTWGLYPVGCGLYEVIAIFTGNAIFGFFDADFEKFFEVNDNSISLERNVEDNIIQAFHSLVYKTWYSMINDRNTFIDSWLTMNVHNRVNRANIFSLSRIMDAFGNEVSFVDTQEADVLKKLKEMKDVYNRNLGKGECPLWIEIVGFASIFTYYKLKMELKDPAIITDIEDLPKVVAPAYDRAFTKGMNMITGAVNATDETLFQNIITNEDRFLKTIDGKESPFTKQLYLPAATRVRFSMVIQTTTEFLHDRGDSGWLRPVFLKKSISPYADDMKDIKQLEKLLDSVRNLIKEQIVTID